MKYASSCFCRFLPTLALVIMGLSHMGCKKGWLDAKPQKSLIAPKTIAEYQAILDNTTNTGGSYNSNSLPATIAFNDMQSSLDEVSADNYIVTDAVYNSSVVSLIEKNASIWAPDIYGGTVSTIDWNYAYKRVYFCNVILEGLPSIVPVTTADQAAWNQVKGSALFFRAYSHYNVAQIFCLPYDKTTSATDLGIPLRLNADFNEPSMRSTVAATYKSILDDLKEAAALLPISTPVNKTYQCRPTKLAANAMLARVYLSMREYDAALPYADNCLQTYSQLLDYNTYKSSSSTYKIPSFNPEVIFHMQLIQYALLDDLRVTGDTSLFQSYNSNDLRKTIYFNTTRQFRGSYTAGFQLFSGLATDELYLIRAECNARKGDTALALKDLNDLIAKRWNSTMAYQRITAVNANDALQKILNERRKELCFRGIRWSDLRRLNKEPAFVKTLVRVINGTTYTLPPNDPKYVLPIPPGVIQLSGMPQNPR